MVKKASNSKNDRSSSTSVTSSKNPLTASNQEDFRKEFQEQNLNIKSMRDVEKCMVRLQELQLTVAGGSKIISGVVFNLKDEELYSKEITSWEVSSHCRRYILLIFFIFLNFMA
ncbi:hypothetical protein Gotur_005491 [Gossypium turneri]